MDTNSLNTVENLISYGKKTALASFLLGSLILFTYYLSHYNTIIYFALFFIVAALILNSYLGFQLIFQLIKKSKLKNKIWQTLFLMLLNIPIGIGYFELGFHIYSSINTN